MKIKCLDCQHKNKCDPISEILCAGHNYSKYKKIENTSLPNKFFENYVAYIEDYDTGRLKVRYVCKHCKKETDNPNNWKAPSTYGGQPDFSRAEFICGRCASKGLKV